MVRQRDKTFRFKASARLQRLFGRDLIPDDDSAVEELVKNAYDSNASEVTISIIRRTSDRDGQIEIRDNGFGLSFTEFERVWMQAGYSEKTGQPLPETGRIQVGEKGIGRFAADKLGQTLVVLTKTQSARSALSVTFDWRKFETGKKRLLSDVPIPYEHVVEETLPPGRSGTILRITKLRADWSDKAIDNLRRRLSRLLSPYDQQQHFRIVLRAPSLKLSGPIVPTEIKDADFEWEVTRNTYGNTRIKRRTRVERGGSEWTKWETTAIQHDATPEAEDFGPLQARFFFFVDRPKKASIGDTPPGVAVYRDGMRVEPAGSVDADWLGLLEKRAKRHGHMPLVPSRLFGFVDISREENPHLQDATNRRAFIHGPQLDAFRDFLKARLTDFETQVETEVSKPRWEKSKQLKSQTLIQAKYKTVSLLSLSLAHEIRQPLQSINTASENIADYLRHNNVAIPQVDSATEVIKRNVARIDKHIQFLKSIGSGRQETETFGAFEAIDEVSTALKEYAQARNVAIAIESATRLSVTNNRATFLNALTNLILNACQAIEGAADGKAHNIRIRIATSKEDVRICVDDDGPGVPEANRSRLFKRQTTTKQGGMGIGLIVWKEALQMFGGDLICERFADPTLFVITVPRGEVNDGQNSAS
jgi:signal transduction histidine kinase